MKSLYSPRYDKSYALVIGINRYNYVGALSYACSDAESITEVLQTKLGFPKENIITLLDEDATKANILGRFLAFESLADEDRLFVFFAGHGMTVEGHQGHVGFLVPVDGNPKQKDTLIRWSELTASADLIPAKHILFVMDACYSGLALQRGASGIGEERFISDMLQRFSRQAITAGKSDETVADGGGSTGKNSIFTGHLLKGLDGDAANASGVLTATNLMNYVYQKVSTDPASNQTPHYGHLKGEGDFILLTPKGEHLPGGPAGDFLVKTVPERPEPWLDLPGASIKPVFADKNGYADPESESFGRNEWSNNLGLGLREENGVRPVRASSWLAFVVEPVSNQTLKLDLGNLAKSLPNQQSSSDNPWDKFRMPSHAITTSRSLILSDERYVQSDPPQDYWTRFLRIENGGALEYCDAKITWETLKSGQPVFAYVQLIGKIWTFLYAAKRLLTAVQYQGGIRFRINMVGTKDSVLSDFAARSGLKGKTWKQPLTIHALHENNSLSNWKCRERNLQFSFKLVLATLGEVEVQQLIGQCANELGLAYNHQSSPRCFAPDTNDFPWEQFGGF